MKLKNIIYLFLLISTVMSAQSSSTSAEIIEATDELILNGGHFTGFANTGGQVFIEDFDGADFGAKLNNAIDAAPAGGIINCRALVGLQTMTSSIDIDTQVRILLGHTVLTFAVSGDKDENMFNIESDGVEIIGLGSSAGGTGSIAGKTVLAMTNDNDDNLLNGYHVYNRGFDCVTIKDLDMTGVCSISGQWQAGTKPLKGVGGIYMEKKYPNTTGVGNTVQHIILKGLFIDQTKAHGIYIHGAMACSISGVRIDQAGGHGVFIYEGTSCNINNTDVSNANYAGFCIWLHSYATLLNCVAKKCGMGFWLRSANSISLISPGCEETINRGELSKKGEYVDWENKSQKIYGLGLTTPLDAYTKDFFIKDVSSDDKNNFCGHGYYISGGKDIRLISPYCKDPAKTTDAGVSVSNKARFIKVSSTNKNSMISHPTFVQSIATSRSYDIEVDGAEVEDLDILWNSDTYCNLPDNNNAQTAPILNESTSTYIR